MKCNCGEASPGSTTIRCCNLCGLPLPNEPWHILWIKMFEEMASTNEPFGLFEPKLWKDKIGDSLWHCGLYAVSGCIIEATGNTMDEAVRNCYEAVTKFDIN